MSYRNVITDNLVVYEVEFDEQVNCDVCDDEINKGWQ